MKIKPNILLNGNMMIVDAGDDDAPLIEMSFCNEATKVSEVDKFRMANRVIEVLAEIL
jgi:hypothetical protein